MQIYWRSLVEGRRKNPLLLGGLTLLSRLYGFALRHRGGKPVRAPLPVVSVGNIAVGGTGKTPTVLALCEQLSDRLSLAVWSRFADEAELIRRRYPSVVVYSGDRALAAALAAAQGAQLLLLDDGMQQRELLVDLHLVVLDGANPWGGKRLLPAGLLREPLTALQRADFVVVTRQVPECFAEQLRHYTQAPWVALEYVLNESFAGQCVGAFCAIGQPRLFYELLERRGAQLVASLSMADHAAPSLAQLQAFAQRCIDAGASQLLCTEKDMVKVPKGLSLGLPISAVRLHTRPSQGHDEWDRLIDRLFSVAL
jgi:tetraacyldisaccharide 4'-kinase